MLIERMKAEKDRVGDEEEISVPMNSMTARHAPDDVIITYSAEMASRLDGGNRLVRHDAAGDVVYDVDFQWH